MTITTSTAPSDIMLHDLCFQVDGKQILRGISAQIMARRTGIVGRNGSGKTTLARIAAGLIAPTSGSAKVGGHDLALDRKQALRTVGILFQNPDQQIIFPTVAEEISFGLRQLGQDKQTAAQGVKITLAAFDKPHWHDAPIHTLSQGQKHLICLMAVVAMAPKIIILDEPFTGLDIPTKAQLNRYLAQYHGNILHISHDPADIADYDHVIWIEQGKIAAMGTAQPTLAAYITAMDAVGGSDDISVLAS